jgi:glycosyltransferase involved in cell wall biosynthesis
LLRFAARRSGMTDARDLAATMISMLRGDEGHQSKEYHRLMDWLVEHDPPDVVVLSNVLLTGFVPSLRKRLRAAVVCMLEDEDEFLDELPADARAAAQSIIAEHCQSIDAFISCSRYYAHIAPAALRHPGDRMHVVHNGIDAEQYRPAAQPPEPPVIGYLSRMHPDKGADLLAEAFVQLRNDPAMAHIRLRLAGGKTPDDQPFVDRVVAMLRKSGVEGRWRCCPTWKRTTAMPSCVR